MANHAQTVDASVSDSRRRQSKRDDAIRRKIENDLSKKKRSNVRLVGSRKALPGTVLSLKPSDPIICKSSTTVYEASQLMSAKRENCILVVNDKGGLTGIFTAKDLAFRIVGSGLNASTITIDKIMTPEPMCAKANDPASEALNLMVSRGFRHLPVLDDENHIVGVLDITKSYAQQMEKLERIHASSKKLYEALDSVQTEIGISQQPLQVFQYFENLKNKMSNPTLETVLDNRTAPIYTNVKTSVYAATVLMKENKTTAVLVKDTNDEVTGIFTSKDVVLRVIAAGLDPKKCSIVRVMTPQPDVAKSSVSIQEALRQMFDGHYLNLPVIDDENEIVGIVDVLKLTYATLNQIKQIESDEAPQQQEVEKDENLSPTTVSTKVSEGPAWNKFWTSLDNETDSVHSETAQASVPEVTNSEFNSFNVDQQLKPSDSVSAFGEKLKERIDLSVAFTFKFKSPALEGRVHRVSVIPTDGLVKLRSLISNKLQAKDFESLRVSPNSDEVFAISYVDDEGDIISLTSDDDLVDCVKINQILGNEKADLYIHNANDAAVITQTKQKNKTQSKGFFSTEVLVPGALLVLATSAAIGFTLSRK